MLLVAWDIRAQQGFRRDVPVGSACSISSVSREKAVRWPQGKVTVFLTRWQFFWRGDCYILTSAWCFTHSKQVKQRQHDGGCLNPCSIGEIRWKLRCWKISQRCQQLPDNLPHIVCHQVCFFVEGKSGGSTLWTIGPADSLIDVWLKYAHDFESGRICVGFWSCL